jgi:aspartate/methionine/tyrosine aminotransferase
VKKEIADFRAATAATLQANSDFTCSALSAIPGLKVVPSSGAMYVMVEVLTDMFDDSVTDDVSFTGLLLDETNVFALPGSCFGAKNFFRVVFCAPQDVLADAYKRIEGFCAGRMKK